MQDKRGHLEDFHLSDKNDVIMADGSTEADALIMSVIIGMVPPAIDGHRN